jgi:hypothetical protein
MQLKSRTLFAISSLVLGAVASACGGGGGTICTACDYKVASYTINPSDLQGGTITSAVMHTEVDHASCPYGGFGSPCTATLDIDVKCKGTGTVTVNRRPNGFSRPPDGVAKVFVTAKKPDGTILTLSPIDVTMNTPDASAPVAPCGGSTTPSVTD